MHGRVWRMVQELWLTKKPRPLRPALTQRAPLSRRSCSAPFAKFQRENSRRGRQNINMFIKNKIELWHQFKCLKKFKYVGCLVQELHQIKVVQWNCLRDNRTPCIYLYNWWEMGQGTLTWKQSICLNWSINFLSIHSIHIFY